MIAEFWNHGCCAAVFASAPQCCRVVSFKLGNRHKASVNCGHYACLTCVSLVTWRSLIFPCLHKNNDRGGLRTSISLPFQMWPAAAGLIFCYLFALEAWLLGLESCSRTTKASPVYLWKHWWDPHGNWVGQSSFISGSIDEILLLWIRKQLSWGLSFELVFWSSSDQSVLTSVCHIAFIFCPSLYLFCSPMWPLCR